MVQDRSRWRFRFLVPRFLLWTFGRGSLVGRLGNGASSAHAVCSLNTLGGVLTLLAKSLETECMMNLDVSSPLLDARQ